MSVVAVLKTSPETVLDDVASVMELAGFRRSLPGGVPVIIKNNISWHLPFLGANTSPWQLDGVLGTLRDAGYAELTCVQNRTVVTDPYRGARLNRYGPILKRYDVPVRFNFEPADMH